MGKAKRCDGFDLTSELVDLANDELERYLLQVDLHGQGIVDRVTVVLAADEYGRVAGALMAACMNQEAIREVVRTERTMAALRLQ